MTQNIRVFLLVMIMIVGLYYYSYLYGQTLPLLFENGSIQTRTINIYIIYYVVLYFMSKIIYILLSLYYIIPFIFTILQSMVKDPSTPCPCPGIQ